MFKLINFIHPLNKLISNVMPATGLKKFVRGQQWAEKARNSEMIQLGEHLATNVLWAKAHLKRTVSKWSIVRRVQIGYRVLRAKEKGDLPVCYQRSG